MLITWASCLLAFWMGYSVNQGGTCAVASVYEVLEHRRARLLVGLAAATAAAALVSIPFVWSSTTAARLAGVMDPGAVLLLGAILFGMGAVLNDACLLGSLGRLGEGELRFVLLPLALTCGLLTAEASGFAAPQGAGDSIMTVPSVHGLMTLGGFAIILALALVFVRHRRQVIVAESRWPLGRAMVVLGAAGGLLYVLAPAWTYADLIQRSLPLAIAFDSETGSLTVIASVAGSAVAARHRRRWLLRVGGLIQAIRTIAGGLLMGMGAALIPGGNDGLILASIPALSPGGTLAYVVMLSTIAALLMIGRSAKRSHGGWLQRR